MSFGMSWCFCKCDNVADEDDNKQPFSVRLPMINYDRCDNVVDEEDERKDSHWCSLPSSPLFSSAVCQGGMSVFFLNETKICHLFL